MTKVQQKLTNDRTAKHYQQLNTKMTALKKEKVERFKHEMIQKFRILFF